MIIPVTLPLIDTPNPNQQILEAEALALQSANELLNDGYSLVIREQVKVGQQIWLHLYFHKPTEVAPVESPQVAAIKQAYRIFSQPPQNGVGGGHPDTRRLNDVMNALAQSGVMPDGEPPVTDETQVDVTPRKLEEVQW